MIVLRGLSRGRRVPVDAFEGRVHSVFETAVNILLRDHLLITVLAEQHGNQPRGVRVDVPQGFCFTDHLTVGVVAACRGGVLRFESEGLQIDLRGVSVWRAALQTIETAGFVASTGTYALTQAGPHPLPLSTRGEGRPDNRFAWLSGHIVWSLHKSKSTQLGSALPVLRDALSGHPSTEKSIAGGSPVALAARPLILALNEAARHGDLQSAVEAAGRLIGLGPGLTPSGDDFLIGFLAGMRIGPPDAVREAFIARFSAEVIHLSIHTNDISRALLLDAARGDTPECIIALVDSIRAGQPESIYAAAGSLLATGSTSGADTLFGFLSALGI